ncbi:hypothetical protein BJV82DRAFT_126545 [Fennellomyces sp. T-0311]|nr:hypothetical protein BJV82DRAFT_126545 [Fennellomyces sp. T-0311]
MDATELFVPVWRLLSKFTAVTHFSFNQHTGVGEGFPQRKLPAFKSLTHLSLKADWLNTSKALAYLKTVCRASPNLLYFSTDCPLNGLSTIRSLLPNLQYLSLNAPYDSFAEDIRDENYKPTDNIGLRTFELYVQAGEDVDPVYTLMDESKNTLEELFLFDPNAGDEDLEEWDDEESLDNEVENWNVLSGFSSKQLRKLNLEIKYFGTETILALLKQCPSLTAVSICNNPQVTDELFDALLQLPKLERLKLMNNVNLTDEGLESFFSRLAGRNTLKYLHLQDLDNCLSKDTLDALANNLNSLTTLVISGKDVHADDLATVGEKLNNLQEVILHLIGGKFHQLSVKLSQLPNLRKLDFTEVAGVDDDDIRILVDGSHSLRKIKLSVCQSITKEGVDYGNKFIVVRNSGWYYS